jgi:hypothetical protein
MEKGPVSDRSSIETQSHLRVTIRNRSLRMHKSVGSLIRDEAVNCDSHIRTGRRQLGRTVRKYGLSDFAARAFDAYIILDNTRLVFSLPTHGPGKTGSWICVRSRLPEKNQSNQDA